MTWRAYLFPLLAATLVLVATMPVYHASEAYANSLGNLTNSTTPQGSPASTELKTSSSPGNLAPKSCSDIPEAKGGLLLGKMIPCLTYTIENSTIQFSAKMVAWLRPLMYTFLVLVITLFGVRVVQGEPEIYKQGFLLLVKVAIVTLILNDLGGTQSIKFEDGKGEIIPAVYGIMNESQAIVASSLTSPSFKCPAPPNGEAKKYSGTDTAAHWAMMDCVLGRLYGFSFGKTVNGQESPNMVLASSMFGLLSGFFFGGAWGVVVFFGMIGVLVSVFMLVVRTALAFLNGYLVVCLMLLICPLMLPLIFMRVTQQYFDGVWRNIVAALIMPVMVTAYSVLALTMYDQMLFAKDSIIQKLFSYSQVQGALAPSKKPCSFTVTGIPDDLRNASVLDVISPFMKSALMPATSAGNNLCGSANVPDLQIKNMSSPEFKKGKETYQNMFFELVQLLILAWLIQLGTNSLTSIIRNLTGAGAALTGLGATTKSDFKFAEAATRARKATIEAAGYDTQGAEFMKRIAPASRAGINEFFTTLSRK